VLSSWLSGVLRCDGTTTTTRGRGVGPFTSGVLGAGGAARGMGGAGETLTLGAVVAAGSGALDNSSNA
jgi:hypothetical protein